MHYQRYDLLLMCLLVVVGGCRHSSVAVVATIPEAGETGVAPTVAVVATLGAPIGKAPAPVLRLRAGAASLPASVSLDQSGEILTLRPERPLALSTTYMAAVRAPGAAPAQAFSWSFATRDVTSWRFVDGGGLYVVNPIIAQAKGRKIDPQLFVFYQRAESGPRARARPA
ncbi:MAG: Ig-like domain-containing protein [Gammaproteobacteria bacterium]|nr:Ig-like domain-containing protein [Gammaproteobacteria bacterium]